MRDVQIPRAASSTEHFDRAFGGVKNECGHLKGYSNECSHLKGYGLEVPSLPPSSLFPAPLPGMGDVQIPGAASPTEPFDRAFECSHLRGASSLRCLSLSHSFFPSPPLVVVVVVVVAAAAVAA